MAVKSEDPETRGLIAYAQIVLDLARKHGGTGWLAYDTHFRAQLFAGGPFKWNEVNPSLLASAVLGNPQLGEGAQSCTRCMAADHSASVCAVSSLDPPPRPAHLVPNRPSPVRQASWPYPPPPLNLEPAWKNHVGATTRACARQDPAGTSIIAMPASREPTRRSTVGATTQKAGGVVRKPVLDRRRLHKPA